MGRILLIEFSEHDKSVFQEIIKVLKQHPDFEILHIKDESVLSIPMIDIYLKQRKVFSGNMEISLTKKEFDLLCLFVINKELVLTYEQMYKKLWDEIESGDIKNTVGCHVRSLRRKLLKAIPNASFDIQSVRAVGYRFYTK